MHGILPGIKMFDQLNKVALLLSGMSVQGAGGRGGRGEGLKFALVKETKVNTALRPP